MVTTSVLHLAAYVSHLAACVADMLELMVQGLLFAIELLIQTCN